MTDCKAYGSEATADIPRRSRLPLQLGTRNRQEEFATEYNEEEGALATSAEEIFEELHYLEGEHKLKPYDAQEFTVLEAIFLAPTRVQWLQALENRAQQLYVAAIAGWQEAAALQRQMLNARLGVAEKPTTRGSRGG